MRRITLFIVSFVTWCLLVWPHNPARAEANLSPWDVQSIIVGVFASLLVALLFVDIFTRDPHKFFSPVRIFYLILYIPVFLYYCVKANLQMVYLVLHPEMPIRPGIVKVKTALKTDSARTALANSITLTPGTLTVDIDEEEGALYVHWIDVKTLDEAEATREIVQRFEWFLSRIFD